MHANVSPVQCKLPKILLPEFSGDPLKWEGFWDQYQVAIDSKNNVSDIDKFNYLKGCLKGEALSAVSGLTLNSENYKEAIQLLPDRFGNKQVLISAHMESLLKINKIKSRENIKGLRMLYNHVESCVRNLRSLKLDTTGYGSLLIPIFKDRLPDDITMIIARKFGGNTWTLDQVMKHFNDELRAQENCASMTSSKYSITTTVIRINLQQVVCTQKLEMHAYTVIKMTIMRPNVLLSLALSHARPFLGEKGGVLFV